MCLRFASQTLKLEMETLQAHMSAADQLRKEIAEKKV